MSAADVILALLDRLPFDEIDATPQNCGQLLRHAHEIEQSPTRSRRKLTNTSTSLSGRKSSRKTEPKKDNFSMRCFRQNSAIRSPSIGMRLFMLLSYRHLVYSSFRNCGNNPPNPPSVRAILPANCPKIPKPRKNKALSHFGGGRDRSNHNGWQVAQILFPQGLIKTPEETVDLCEEIVKLDRSRLYIVVSPARDTIYGRKDSHI